MDNRSVELQAEYQNRFESSDSYRDAVWKILCNDFFQNIFQRLACYSTWGAGWGEFSRNIKAAKKYAMGLESRLRKKSFWIFDLSTSGLFNDVTP